MLTLMNKLKPAMCAKDVDFVGNTLYVFLKDGNEISVALEDVAWLGWLLHAAPEQRAKWSLEPGGFAVYWEELDDGIEISHLLEMQTRWEPDRIGVARVPQYAGVD